MTKTRLCFDEAYNTSTTQPVHHSINTTVTSTWAALIV